jgi:hypothetical protein
VLKNKHISEKNTTRKAVVKEKAKVKEQGEEDKERRKR